jgi:hypothetical protein
MKGGADGTPGASKPPSILHTHYVGKGLAIGADFLACSKAARAVRNLQPYEGKAHRAMQTQQVLGCWQG